MKCFYHAATRSFLDTATTKAEQIPADAVELTLDHKRRLLAGERLGQIIVLTSDGKLMLETPAPDLEAPARLERAWRNLEIQRVSWLRDRHRDEVDQHLATTLDTDQFNGLLGYIQQLRDWPESGQFPDVESRPPAPDWLAQQIQ